MDIIVGKTAGFCYGVKRAVDGAKEVLKKEKNIYGLGEIVHNKEVVKGLERIGMKFIDDINEAKGKVIVRAHGISKEIYKKAKEKHIKLIDFTCPKVLKIHGIVKEYSGKGYYIFLLGTKKHPENIGTLSYCKENTFVIEKEDDTFEALELLRKSKIKKLLIIAQTTYSLEKFDIVEEIIKKELPRDIKLVVKNAICHATEIRQKETEKMSKESDCMIIIGGKNSSNTKKLYDIAVSNCKKTIAVENADDLELEIINSNEKIGIMAGASTPKESIDNVVKKLYEKVKEKQLSFQS